MGVCAAVVEPEIEFCRRQLTPGNGRRRGRKCWCGVRERPRWASKELVSREVRRKQEEDGRDERVGEVLWAAAVSLGGARSSEPWAWPPPRVGVGERRKVMSCRELLDARRALRSVGQGPSGPKSRRQRGEWETRRSISWVSNSISAAQPDSICVCESQLIGILPTVSDRHTHTLTHTQLAVVCVCVPKRPLLTLTGNY